MAKDATAETVRTLPVEVVDKSGKRHHQVLRATIISPREGLRKIEKQDGLPQVPEGGRGLGHASSEEDDLFHTKIEGRATVIDPPYDLSFLALAMDNSNELGQNIRTMVTNTVKFGHRLKESMLLRNEKIRSKFETEINTEKARLNTRLSAVHPKLSLTEIRARIKHDKVQTGNGYMELIDAPNRELVGLGHIHAHTVRMTSLERDPVVIDVPVINEDLTIGNVKMLSRFRRYVQIRAERIRFFKEAGDPRDLDFTTGEYGTNEKPIEFPMRATSVLHHKIYSPHSSYGVPEWIGAIFEFFGSRKAQELNFNTLSNNAVPSLFLIVENGTLTDGSVKRVTEFIESLQQEANYSSMIILEGEPMDEGNPNPTAFKIRIEPTKPHQQRDELWLEYDKNNRDKIRQSFRLPPIFVGRCSAANTEYLTERGWKKYEEISSHESIATYNAATGAIEYQVPTARHQYDYDGELIHLKNRGIDALVTPNHRMWVRPTVPTAKPERSWSFVEAGDLAEITGGNGDHIELPVSGSWVGKHIKTFTIPRNSQINGWEPSKPSKNPTRDLERYDRHAERDVAIEPFLQFLGYFVSEGSTTETRGPIVLSQRANDTADKMISTLKTLGFDPGVVESRPGELNIGISHAGLWSWLREYCGTGSKTKKMPVWVLSLTPDLIMIFLDALIEGDGNRPVGGSPGSFRYCTTSKTLNDQLHEACLKCSIALTTREVDRSEKGWATTWQSYGHFDRLSLLNIHNQILRVPYKGKVSCFTVSNGMLVTRRNGRVLISGNSEDYNRSTAAVSKRVGDEQVFGPDRADDDELFNRFVMTRWKARFHFFKSMHPNITDDEILVKMANILEKSGGMTPRRADNIGKDVFGEDFGPEPEGIDLDVPYSLQFALAQVGAKTSQAEVDKILSGDVPNGETIAEEIAEDMIEKLQNFRKSVDQQILKRFDDNED